MRNGSFCNQIEIWCKICMPFFSAMQKFQDLKNDDDYYTGKKFQGNCINNIFKFQFPSILSLKMFLEGVSSQKSTIPEQQAAAKDKEGDFLSAADIPTPRFHDLINQAGTLHCSGDPQDSLSKRGSSIISLCRRKTLTTCGCNFQKKQLFKQEYVGR